MATVSVKLYNHLTGQISPQTATKIKPKYGAPIDGDTIDSPASYETEGS